MKLEHCPEEKLKKEILEIMARHLDLKKYKVFFSARVSRAGATSAPTLMSVGLLFVS